MSLQIVPTSPPHETLQPASTERFVAENFDRAYLLFNLFIDGPRACLDHSDAVFRTLARQGAYTDRGFYRTLAQRIRALPQSADAVEGQDVDSVLCWLLKDAAALNYAAIAEVMELERDQVAARIAGVRGVLAG